MRDETFAWKPVVTVLVAIIGCIGTILSASWVGDVIVKPLFSEPTITTQQSMQRSIETSVAATVTANNQSFSPDDAVEQVPFTQSQYVTPTPIGIRNPSGRIPAGETIIMDGFSLVVKPSFKIGEGWEGETLIYIEMIVTNISNRSRLFSYNRPNSLSLKDNFGNSFRPFDNASDFYQSFQFSFDSGEMVTFKSAYNAHGRLQIPVFEGEIASGASQLIVIFNNFGPFSGFEVSIDL